MSAGDRFWSDAWHWCVLAAGFLADAEGRLDDNAYVRELAYRWYEEGAFRDRARAAAEADERATTIPAASR